jgi:hypothetical protein
LTQCNTTVSELTLYIWFTLPRGYIQLTFINSTLRFAQSPDAVRDVTPRDAIGHVMQATRADGVGWKTFVEIF